MSAAAWWLVVLVLMGGVLCALLVSTLIVGWAYWRTGRARWPFEEED